MSLKRRRGAHPMMPLELFRSRNGVFNTSRQIGGALAVAVFGALLAQQGNFMGGLRTSLLIAAGVALATAATSLLFRSPRRQLAAVTEPAVVDAESTR